MRTPLPALAVSKLAATWEGPPSDAATVEAGTADVFHPDGESRATVVLLHGWSDRTPRNYLQWIRHLTGRNVTVVFPRYQASLRSSRRQMLAGAVAGVRDGLAELGLTDRPLIAAGYSYGAGLAVVAAAEAERWGIPVPSAVFGVFPYFVRGHDRGPLVVPPTTTVTMLVGDRDQVVGERGAASIVNSIAPHPAAVRVLASDDDCTYGHLSALQSTPAAQSAFWSPLDRIVDRLAPL
ncbi:MAG: hypothetical protein WCN97_01655 [Thermoleophilia bacterium]